MKWGLAMGKKKIIALGSGIITLVVAAGITDDGEYILTYIYAQNDNEYVPVENETMPAG